MKKTLFLLWLTVLSFTSCVPYKNTVYLQGELAKTQSLTTYKIKKSDILFIDINSNDSQVQQLFNAGSSTNSAQNMTNQSLYFKGYVVDEKGDITIPLGTLHAEGLSFKEVKDKIKKLLLQKKLKSIDNIYINVKLAGIPYTILGEVKTPQVSVLYKENPNIFDAILCPPIVGKANKTPPIIFRSFTAISIFKPKSIVL